jgi:predicted Zn-dependent peptidase
MPGAVADRVFVRLLYGNHPYGHTPLGTEPALASMTVDDVRGFHAAMVRPSETTLVAVGDCDHDAIHRLAAEAFADWQGETAPSAPASEVLPAPSRLIVLPRPGAPQSELRIGHVGVPRDTPDYHALVVANTILGGQFVSRINLNLREDKGFTYGARTSFDFRRLPGPFTLQVSVETAATARAIQESFVEIAGIRGPRVVTADELALGAAALTRGYARNFETAEQVARAVTQIALFDLPDDYYSQFVPSIERVTIDDVMAASVKHLDPDGLVTLIVGDLDRISQDLPALNLGSPVVLSADSF